jgi:hypothetical protein
MNYSNLDHFIAVSYLYFLITDKDTENVSREELEELIVAINETHDAAVETDQYLV